MKAKQQMFLTMSGLVLLSGCMIGNLTDWADDTFYQSQMYKEDNAVVKQYLKSIRLYDQFETVAMFDALWNADEVRTAYSRLYAKVMGKDEEGELAFLRRQLSANTYSISFYVLSLSSIPLTVTPPTWVVYLEIDGKRYLPAEIKLAELPVEYVTFFGKRVNAHKQPYEIKFDRKDSEGNDILAGKKMVKLFFTNPRYFGSVGWQLDEQGNVTNQVVLDKISVKKEPKPSKKQCSLERRTKKRKQEEEQKQQEAQEKKQSRSLMHRALRKKKAVVSEDMPPQTPMTSGVSRETVNFLELEAASPLPEEVAEIQQCMELEDMKPDFSPEASQGEIALIVEEFTPAEQVPLENSDERAAEEWMAEEFTVQKVKEVNNTLD